MGNHALIDRYERFNTRVSTDIKIFHFGVRSREHFCRKVRNGGSAVEANSSFNTQIASHWRDWYRMDKEGLLETEYKKHTMSEPELIKREQTSEFVRVNTDTLFNGLDV